MVVGNRLVISFLNKDYELKSWNEQGEITQIKGMLTIAFLVISSCSHKDSWKQLYLIIKIPYMVNMSANKYVDIKGDVKLEKGEPMFTPELYHQQNKKIKELSLKIDKLESEIEKLKKENLRLKIISGEARSGWQKDRDLIYRNNPDTSYPEQYRCPIYFKYDDTRKVRYYLNEDGTRWVEFYHCSSLDYDKGTYNMPHSAYLWLKGELPEQKKDKVKKIKTIEIKEYDDLIKHIELFGFFEYNFRKLENVFKFLKEYTEKSFNRQFFTGKCDLSPRTVSKYLEMLETCKLIIKLPDRGKHKVNIK